MKWLVALGFALLLIGLASACITYPTVEVGEYNFSAFIGPIHDYLNISPQTPLEAITAGQFNSFMEYLYRDAWSQRNITNSEKATIWEFVRHGYSVKKMSPAEYSEFLANATEITSDPEDCAYYKAVAYENGFAGYAVAFDKNPECPAAKIICSGGFYQPFLNDLKQATGSQPPPADGIPSPAPTSATPAPTDATPAPSTPSRQPESNDWEFPFISGASAAPTGADITPPPKPPTGIDYSGYLSIGAAIAILFAAAVAFSIIMRRPHEDIGVDDMTVHRTLSSSTRAALLRELVQRDLTPTDLSAKVGKSKATVVEHLDRLIDARLVEKIERDGRKFVFYRLTPKGKAVLRRAG